MPAMLMYLSPENVALASSWLLWPIISIVVGLWATSRSVYRIRFNTLETKFDTRFDALETKMDTKFDALETKMETKFDAMDTRFNALDMKLDAFLTAAEVRARAVEFAVGLRTRDEMAAARAARPKMADVGSMTAGGHTK